MNEIEFNEYCAQHAVGPSARAFIERVRGGEPARRVGGGRSNVACRFASKKMGLTIQGESENPEFAYVTTLEFDNDVIEFYDQPETLSVSAISKNGKPITKSYTPDYLVLSRSKGPILVECKQDKKAHALIESDANWWIDKEGTIFFEPLRTWCELLGLTCKIVLASEISAVRVQNLQMLADYFGTDVPPVSADERTNILAYLASPPWATRRQLFDRYPQLSADDLNWMIAHQELYVDLDNQVLADEIRTLIFRNSSAAQAYEALERSQINDPLAIRAISLDAGSTIVLDGTPYTVLQQGETSVLLQDARKNVRDIPNKAIDNLIAEGLIQADLSTQTTTSAAAQQRLLQTSPKDMDIALGQFKKLNADPKLLQIPPRTLEWLRSRFRQGEQLYGSGFLGLIPDIRKRGNRSPKLHPDVATLISDVINERVLTPKADTIVMCFAELTNRCENKFLRPPSEKTFRQYVKNIRQEILVRNKKGHKSAHPYEPWHVQLEYKTPRHGQRPFEIGHIDHTELDVHLVDEKDRKQTYRLWLTVLIDAYSRKILAWYMTRRSPSHRSVMTVIRICLQMHGRGCDHYVVDQGAEFNSTFFEMLLARLGAHKKERPASKPRFGSIIERFFGISNQLFLRHLLGNNQHLKDPRSLSPSHDPRNQAVWTFREFAKAWQYWLDNYYHRAAHGTLGISPNEAFDEGLRRYGYRAHRRFAFDAAMRLLCLPETIPRELKINADQGYVEFANNKYHGSHIFTGKHKGLRVPAKYDPFDITRLYVYLETEWHELRSVTTSQIAHLSTEEIKIFSEEWVAKYMGTYQRRKNNISLLGKTLKEVQPTEDVLVANTIAQEIIPSQVPANKFKNAPFNADAHWANCGFNDDKEEHENN